MRVVQPGGDPRLPDHPVTGQQGVGLAQPGLDADLLDRHPAREQFVPALPDHAHAADGDPVDQAVAPGDQLSDRQSSASRPRSAYAAWSACHAGPPWTRRVLPETDLCRWSSPGDGPVSLTPPTGCPPRRTHHWATHATCVRSSVAEDPTVPPFEGFPAAAAEFYQQLTRAEHREFWNAHRDVYETRRSAGRCSR